MFNETDKAPSKGAMKYTDSNGEKYWGISVKSIDALMSIVKDCAVVISASSVYDTAAGSIEIYDSYRE